MAAVQREPSEAMHVSDDELLPAPTLVVDAATALDFVFAAAIRRGASLTTLEPNGDRYQLTIRRGARVLGVFLLAGDVGARAVGRLARMTGLDPLAEAGTPEAAANVGRLSVRAGRHSAQLFVAIAARRDGFEVEVRATAIDGADPTSEAALRRCPRCGAYAPPNESICERDRTALRDVVDDPRPGGTIAAYRIDEELGNGAMGMVYGARHAILDRPVAIKVLHRALSNDVHLARAVLAEARAASRVRHPALLEITDYGILLDGRPYVVMERLDGESLHERLDREPALQPLAALGIAREIARALGAAHDAGVVHNDLKPSNVMLLPGGTASEPRLKVIDFGAASLIDANAADREIVVGTPQYMSPEHIRGAPTDARSDLYALGVVLFRMLAGELPFDGEDSDSIMGAHLADDPPTLRAALPRAVTALVARLLAKTPEARHQSAAELEADLTRAIASLERPAWRRWLP